MPMHGKLFWESRAVAGRDYPWADTTLPTESPAPRDVLTGLVLQWIQGQIRPFAILAGPLAESNHIGLALGDGAAATTYIS